MFHEIEVPVTDQPSTSAVDQKENSIRLTRVISIFIVLACLLTVLWFYEVFKPDPYVNATLSLQGSLEQGEKLFKINCVGCHGISAQGLLGPDLHEVSSHLSEKEIINQVMQGKTPPMPSFQMDPQKMSDLLTYLKSLN